MENRYMRNIPSVSEEEQRLLARKSVLVAGSGGLGGYVSEYLARLGVGTLTIVDGDVFEENNLNRQILSSVDLLGTSKTEAAYERLKRINPDITVSCLNVFLDENNGDEIVKGHDLVIDALDNIPSRLILEDICERQNIPLVHGAIQGWSLQVSVIFPKERTLHHLYGNTFPELNKTSLSFTPAVCAGIQVAEALKLLCGKQPLLSGKLLICDLRETEWRILPLKD